MKESDSSDQQGKDYQKGDEVTPPHKRWELVRGSAGDYYLYSNGGRDYYVSVFAEDDGVQAIYFTDVESMSVDEARAHFEVELIGGIIAAEGRVVRVGPFEDSYQD